MSVCSAIFFTCSPVAASQARTLRSGEQVTSRSPSGVQATSSTAFLWPGCGVVCVCGWVGVWVGWGVGGGGSSGQAHPAPLSHLHLLHAVRVVQPDTRRR